MNRSARFFAGLALATALCSALRVAASPLGISYARVFDTDPTHGTFVIGDVAFARASNLVSDAVFGIDVQLPDATEPFVAVAFAAAPEATYAPAPSSTSAPAVTIRLHQASLQVRYGNFLASPPPIANAASGQAATVRSQAITAGHFGYAVPSSAPDQTSLDRYAYPLESAGTFAARAFPAYAPQSQGLEVQPTLPVRIGKIEFTGSVDSSHAASAPGRNAFNAMQLCGTAEPASVCPYYAGASGSDDRLSATTNFNVRAGARNLKLGVSGGLEHLQLSDQSSLAYTPWSAGVVSSQLVQTPAGAGYSPGSVDVTKQQLNASVAVPITRAVTLGLGYNTQRFLGSYGAATETNIDARKNSYLGNITYEIPHTSSQITLSARQYRYQDSFVPNFTAKQTRADVNFTVKF